MSLKQHNFRNVDHFANWVKGVKAGYTCWACMPERLPYRDNFVRIMNKMHDARTEGFERFNKDPVGYVALNDLRYLMRSLAMAAREHYAQDIKAEREK
tara:strand:+ start:719 stop:1012 length:294 start_codon:yes stop_codon:yes gene_type:complete